MHEGPVELYLGDPAAAEGGLRGAMEVLERLGEQGYRSTAAAWLAGALNEQARYAEVEAATLLSEELAAPDDTSSQVGWRMERARAIAYRGELEEAERLARAAVALSELTDGPVDKGACALALAESCAWRGGAGRPPRKRRRLSRRGSARASSATSRGRAPSSPSSR